MSNKNMNSYFPGEETSLNSSKEAPNKRQKISIEEQQNVNPNDFLFDYDFSLESNIMTQQPAATVEIPNEFFIFGTEQSNSKEPLDKKSMTITTSNMPSPSGPPLPSTNTEKNLIQPFTTISVPQQQISRTYVTSNNDPHNQAVYTIVVGGKPFRLSWESLKSDGPHNFFLEYFRKKKNTKVMHIDRDPDIFEMIVRHLRGYYIKSNDDIQNQSLLFDATYYGLERLRKMLQEYLYVNVGGRVFRLPWDLFRKDGTHNFFTGPLMHSVLTPHTDEGNSPPIYIDRDPDIFQDIINHLRGYTIHIRDEVHRKNLQRDAQYYVFRQLSDKLLTAQQTVAGFGDGSNPEILLLLRDIRVVNMLAPKAVKLDQSFSMSQLRNAHDWSLTQIQYKREGPPHALLVQVSDLSMQIHRGENNKLRLTYEMKETDMKKMKNMAHVAKAVNGINMEIYLDEFCAITIDDTQVKSCQDCLDHDIIETNWQDCTKCNGECSMSRLILQRAICGVHLIDGMITLCALRLEAISSRFRLNLKRQFLSG